MGNGEMRGLVGVGGVGGMVGVGGAVAFVVVFSIQAHKIRDNCI